MRRIVFRPRLPKDLKGRIPDAFIQDLLARTDIVELIGERVELKRAGRELRGLSPFSGEKTPSFFVSPAKQMFFDFSASKNGNAIGFLMEFDRLSFVEAVDELARRAGIEVPREGGDDRPRPSFDGPLDALATAQRLFQSRLAQTPAALDYLHRRGVSDDTAAAFGIGYAADSWDALSRQFKQPAAALEAGLLIEREAGGGQSGNVYDRFRNRLMFPIRDTRGRVIGFGGRTLGNDPAKYLNSPDSPLFHKGRNLYGLYEAKQARKTALGELLVVEGYMDVVMLAQHGITQAVATLGTATTAEHLQLIFRNTSRVVFCFDGDRAGRTAAWRALEQALTTMQDGRECAFMFLPDGHDPDTLVQAEGAEAFRARIAQAEPLSAFLLRELAGQVNLAQMEGRAKLLALAKPHLAKMPDGALKDMVADELGRMARVSSPAADTVRAGAVSAARGQAIESRLAAESDSPAFNASRPVRRALQLLLHAPQFAEAVGHVELLAECGEPGVALLVEAIDWLHGQPQASAAQLLHAFARQPAKAAALQQLMVGELERPEFGPTLADRVGEAGLREEFVGAVRELVDRARHERCSALLAQSRTRPLKAAELAELRALQKDAR